MNINTLRKILINHIQSANFDENDDSLKCLQDLAEINLLSKSYSGDRIGDADIVPISGFSIYAILMDSENVREIVTKALDRRPDLSEQPEMIRNSIRNEIREYPGFSEVPDRLLNDAIDDLFRQIVDDRTDYSTEETTETI